MHKLSSWTVSGQRLEFVGKFRYLDHIFDNRLLFFCVTWLTRCDADPICWCGFHWRFSTWGVSDRYLIYAGRLDVSNAEVLQRSGLSTVGDILRYRPLNSGHGARLDPGVPAHDALRLMVDTYEGRKSTVSWRRPPGRPRNVWLNDVQEDVDALPLSTLWRSEIAMQGRHGPLGLLDEDDDDASSWQ